MKKTMDLIVVPGGGNAAASFAAGALMRLQMNIKPGAILGNSGGALFSALYSYYNGDAFKVRDFLMESKRTKDTWRRHSLLKLWLTNPSGLASYDPLMDRLSDLKGSFNIPFGFQVMNLMTDNSGIESIMAYKGDRGNAMWPHVVRSMSIQGLIESDHLVDPGPRNIIPVEICERLIATKRYERVFIISGAHFNPKGIDGDELKGMSALDHIADLISRSTHNTYYEDKRALMSICSKYGVDVHLLEATKDLSIYKFDEASTMEAINHGFMRALSLEVY